MEEQQVLWTAEPFLQPQTQVFLPRFSKIYGLYGRGTVSLLTCEIDCICNDNNSTCTLITFF